MTYTDSVNQFIAACVVRALARRVRRRLWPSRMLRKIAGMFLGGGGRYG